jgi:hypothetical protein
MSFTFLMPMSKKEFNPVMSDQEWRNELVPANNRRLIQVLR